MIVASYHRTRDGVNSGLTWSSRVIRGREIFHLYMYIDIASQV